MAKQKAPAIIGYRDKNNMSKSKVKAFFFTRPAPDKECWDFKRKTHPAAFACFGQQG